MTQPTPADGAPADTQGLDALAEFVQRCDSLLVLTGAGCSTDSGIPDYRDADGEWKRGAPIQYRDFVMRPEARQRYWARSAVGWPRMAQAQPNATHQSLARLERQDAIATLVTQNVDGLHQRAGSRQVIDMHGRLDRVACMQCQDEMPRDAFQAQLEHDNPWWRDATLANNAPTTPDGDVDLGDADYARFVVRDCAMCGGVLKPGVVFFGESIPRDVTDACNAALDNADGLLVVGSSLMVFSGFRFVRTMAAAGKPTAAINLGRTRADDLLDIRVRAEAGAALAQLLARLADA